MSDGHRSAIASRGGDGLGQPLGDGGIVRLVVQEHVAGRGADAGRLRGGFGHGAGGGAAVEKQQVPTP